MRALELLEHGIADGQKALNASPSVLSSGLEASTARPPVLKPKLKSIQLQDHHFEVAVWNDRSDHWMLVV